MAQDFGDDMGNALLNFVTRQAENYLRFGRGRERAFDWWQRHYKKEGNTPEAAKAMAEKQSSREQVVVPFGTSEEAAYYAQVCRENGTYAAAYTDKQGNGFLAFAKEDVKTVAGYAPQFKDVMARLDEQRITDALNHAEPVNKKTMDSLTELTSYPDLPAEDVTVIPVTIRYKDALITGSVKMLTTEYSASGSAYKTYADFAVFKDDDIVFLVVTYCILSYFIDNALDLVSAIYSIFNDLVGNVSDKLQSKNWYEPGIKMTKDDAADATFGGCFLLLIFGLISWAVGLVFYAVSMVVALGRSVQLYVYAAFSPIPISLLGFEETKQIGIGYLKNFAAAALAGVVMVLILYLYPHLVTALAVSGGLGKAEMLGLAQGVETFDSFGVIIKTIAVLITTMMGLVKSGSWAKEILGA